MPKGTVDSDFGERICPRNPIPLRAGALLLRFDESIAHRSAVSRPSNPSSLFRLETAVGHENYITACTFGATDGRGAQDTGRRTGRD
jgi:hypothetical protein